MLSPGDTRQILGRVTLPGESMPPQPWRGDCRRPVSFLQGERKTPPTATRRLWHGGAGTEKRPTRRLWWASELGVSTTIFENLFPPQFNRQRPIILGRG